MRPDRLSSGTLRQALRADVPEIQRVRHAVRENRLVSTVISDADVLEAIERSGRGWVVECVHEDARDGESCLHEDARGGESMGQPVLAGFAIGNTETGNIWALFVDPAFEARGVGRRLHDEMVAWLWSRGLRRLWLTTEPGTRAQQFYERAGWRNCGPTPRGNEIHFELDAP